MADEDMVDEEFESIPKITLDRDEIADRQSQRAGFRRKSAEDIPATEHKATSNKSGKPPLMMISLALMVLLLIAAEIWIIYLHRHLGQTQENLVAATARIEQLENKLASTDTTLTKSEVTLAAKIKSMDGLIDMNKNELHRLAGVTEQNRRLGESNASLVQKQQVAIQELQAQGKQNTDQLSSHAQQLKTLDSTSRENNQRVEILQESVNDLGANIKSLGEKQSHLESDAGKRLTTLEDAAKSNDVFRRNTNDELNKIKEELVRQRAATK